MSQKIDVSQTVTVIRNMSDMLRKSAIELEQIAKYVEDGSDFDRVSEAITCVTSLIPNLRMDLLVTRPVRELGRAANKSS